MLMDNSHRKCELLIPEGTEESEVTVEVQYCNGRGAPIETGTIIQQGKPRAKPKPTPTPKKTKTTKVQPKPTVKTETKDDTEDQPKTEKTPTVSPVLPVTPKTAADEKADTAPKTVRYGYSMTQ
jgi:hypothetical protein